MATTEHCLYCFESLAAYLENRKSMTLEQVHKSYSEYTKPSLDADDSEETTKKQLPALRRLADTSSSDSSGLSSPSSTSSLSVSGVSTAATSLSSVVSLDAECPLFVTWNTISSTGAHNLRGCIGTFEARPLDKGLSSYAITSAIHDSRFDPISARELSSLEVAVTLLTDFEDADDEMDWELGTHGIRISFYDHGREHGATYLPDVASEQGWTKEETLVSLMRKAGWTGNKAKWRALKPMVVRYQGQKQSLEFGEFKKWRDWADKKAKD